MKRLTLTLAVLATAIPILGPTGARAQTPGVQRQVLTIDEAVRIASERNITLGLANARVDNAGARVTSSFGAFLPQISLTGGYSRPLTDGNVFFQGVEVPGSGSRPDVLQANATASMLLFDGFSRTAAYSNAQSSFNAAVEDLNRDRQSVAFQTRSAFLAALRAEQLIEVRVSDLELARENLVRVQGLVQAGVAQEGQIYSEEAAIANAELSLEQARTDAVVAYQQLGYLLNIDTRGSVQLSSEGVGGMVDSAEVAAGRQEFGNMEALYQRQAELRADLRSARLRVDAADASITAARSGYFPSVSASIGYGWQRSDQTTNSDASLGVNFQFTPFDGFRTNEQVQLARAQKLTAELELRRVQLQAQGDLQQAVARLEGAGRMIHAASRSVIAARQNRFAAEQRYRAGVGSYSDFLLASAQYLTAQINQVNAAYNYRLSVYEVRYHLGE